VKQTLNKK